MTEDGNPRELAIENLSYTSVPATPDRLPALRSALISWAERAGVPHGRVEGLALAVYEAMANVIEHAYPDDSGTFDLLASHLPEQGHLEVVVVDRGQWKPPSDDPGPLHGRGIPLMHDLAQQAAVHTGPAGTRAVLRWPL